MLNEGEGGFLSCLEAAGLNIARAHAARNIHGQDDGSLVGGQVQDGRRASQGKYQAGETKKEQGERKMAAPV